MLRCCDGKWRLVCSCEQGLGVGREDRQERERERKMFIDVMCNEWRIVQREESFALKRDLNWRWREIQVSPHHTPPTPRARRIEVRW